MIDPVVIVGAGQAGFQVAASLRDEGCQAPIALLGDEPNPPYQRPPLSKSFLAGKVDESSVWLRPLAFYSERRIERFDAIRVSAIDRQERHVYLADGRTLTYQHLVLATGARARIPELPGIDLAGVWALRTLADARGLRSALQQSRRITVIGAGFIGLEVAVIAQALGLQVDVLELGDRPLQRAVSSLTADVLRKTLEQRGVRFHFRTGVQALLGSQAQVEAVRFVDGQELPTDLVVIGIGVVANDELAAKAGLPVRDGVLVDEQLVSCDPAVSAIGDCARFPLEGERMPVRLESVQNAVDQARCVASRLVGRPSPYRKVPWFWSDQGDQRLQIAGLAQPSDTAVLRGSPSDGRFSVLRLRDGRLTAVESINNPADHMAARKLLVHPHHIALDRAADSRVKLAELVPST